MRTMHRLPALTRQELVVKVCARGFPTQEELLRYLDLQRRESAAWRQLEIPGFPAVHEAIEEDGTSAGAFFRLWRVR